MTDKIGGSSNMRTGQHESELRREASRHGDVFGSLHRIDKLPVMAGPLKAAQYAY